MEHRTRTSPAAAFAVALILMAAPWFLAAQLGWG